MQIVQYESFSRHIVGTFRIQTFRSQNNFLSFDTIYISAPIMQIILLYARFHVKGSILTELKSFKVIAHNY